MLREGEAVTYPFRSLEEMRERKQRTSARRGDAYLKLGKRTHEQDSIEEVFVDSVSISKGFSRTREAKSRKPSQPTALFSQEINSLEDERNVESFVLYPVLEP